jgi:hypothetical protein
MPPALSSRCFIAAACVALSPLAAARVAAAQTNATVSYDGELAKAAAKPHPLFKAAGMEWNCSTTRCSTKGPGADPVGACKALAQQVGPLKSFRVSGKALDVHQCSAPAPSMVAAPLNKSMAVAPPPQAKAVAPTMPPPAPAAASSKKGAATSGGVAITTPLFTVTGTGVAAAMAPFTPMAWTTAPFTVTGTGAAPASAPPAGIAFTTDTFRVSGSPP